MNKSPRYHIIIHIFPVPILGEVVPSYGRKMATKSLHFLVTFWFNRWRCKNLLAREIKYSRKPEKSAFREIFVARYIPILQYYKFLSFKK